MYEFTSQIIYKSITLHSSPESYLLRSYETADQNYTLSAAASHSLIHSICGFNTVSIQNSQTVSVIRFQWSFTAFS